MGAYKVTISGKPRRQPISETGIYLRRHSHRWLEGGTHQWPSGKVEPLWKCTVCGDVICCAAAPAHTDRSQ